jgi:hypothetical protein
MATLDEIHTVAFVLLKVLVVTAPRKKQGCASNAPLAAQNRTLGCWHLFVDLVSENNIRTAKQANLVVPLNFPFKL